MKKLIVVCMLILLAAPAFAAGKSGSPADKGNFVVSLPLFGFGIGMGDLHKDGRYFLFGANGYVPDIQYCFIDNLAIGGRFGYNYEKEAGAKTTTFTIGPVVDYYFNFKLGPVVPYAGCGLFYTSTGNGEDVTEIQFELHGGVVYMLGKHLSAYGQMYFDYDNASNSDSVSGQKIGFVGGVKAFF